MHFCRCRLDLTLFSLDGLIINTEQSKKVRKVLRLFGVVIRSLVHHHRFLPAYSLRIMNLPVVSTLKLMMPPLLFRLGGIILCGPFALISDIHSTDAYIHSTDVYDEACFGRLGLFPWYFCTMEIIRSGHLMALKNLDKRTVTLGYRIPKFFHVVNTDEVGYVGYTNQFHVSHPPEAGHHPGTYKITPYAHSIGLRDWFIDVEIPPRPRRQRLTILVVDPSSLVDVGVLVPDDVTRLTRQLEYFKGRISSRPNTDALADALAITQHHDAVSGTSLQRVANDYEKQLSMGYMKYPLLNFSYCPPSEVNLSHGKSLVRFVPV
ncbi:hypothetical protein GIB67_013642 [Kingdonia uniflora]|uniref:Glycoside hydrolase family 38 central domain-containing protein n=1 Tax=Kingdonia uniflora TaxID=39325 RepID=A0A7J7NQG7_9MAGN|nr:hypothetical protein GIB67_013642 [Kingdonia uniflora]